MFVVGALALTLLSLGVQLWTTDFGFDERLDGTTRVVTEVDPGGAAARAGIAAGDVILEDPGIDTLKWPWTEREVYGWTYRLGRALRQHHVPMRIRHDAIEKSVVVVPDDAPSLPAAIRQLRRIGTRLPVAFAFLGVALLLAGRRSESTADESARRVVTSACALLGAAFVCDTPAPAWPFWFYPVAALCDAGASAAGGALLAYFAWTYPTRSKFVDRKLVRAIVITLGVLCSGFSILNSMHVVNPPEGLHGNTANMAFGTGVALLIFVGLAWQRKRARDLIARRQATWLLAFCSAGIFVPMLIYMIPQYAFGFGLPFASVIALPFPLLIPIGFAAVITRYRLFASDGMALRATPYGIALGTSLVVCVSVSVSIEALFSSHAGTAAAGRWLGTIAALVMIEPFRRGARGLIDRAFARDRDAFHRRCAELAATLARCSDAGAIETEIRGTLDAKDARLLKLAEVLEAAAVREVEAQLARAGTVRIVDLKEPSAVDALLALGFELLVAVPADDLVLALTLPGGSHQLARPEHDALALVGRVIGATLSREAARRTLETEIVRAEHERRQIAMELHDGIGATLTAARSMTRRLRDPLVSSETLDALDATLREGLGDLRTSLWGLDPVDASWGGLVAKIRRQVGDQCAAEQIAFKMRSDGELSAGMSAAGRLAVLRVVQEAVANAVKHGAPRHLEICMTVGEGRIDVAVEDDGKGAASATPEGRGLANMERRIESLGGAFRFESTSEVGTRVSFSLPMEV
jgi:signal transduction histidine kinase